MTTIRTRITAATLALASAMSLPAQLLVASPRSAPAAAPHGTPPITLAIAPVASSTGVFAPVALVPLESLALQEQREIIAGQLIDLGREADAARGMAAELTADDLAVLLANPKMMRKAGAIDVIIWALLIAGVVVALVIAADGSILVSA